MSMSCLWNDDYEENPSMTSGQVTSGQCNRLAGHMRVDLGLLCILVWEAQHCVLYVCFRVCVLWLNVGLTLAFLSLIFLAQP